MKYSVSVTLPAVSRRQLRAAVVLCTILSANCYAVDCSNFCSCECKTSANAFIVRLFHLAGTHPDLFLVGGGGVDPEAIYNIMFDFKN
jgi:hypothetical protein